MSLEFVEGEFKLPAVVIERGEFRAGRGGGAEERGEELVGVDAEALHADGAHAERGGEVGMLSAGETGLPQLHQGIVRAEALEDLGAAGRCARGERA
jgi:hypothetical protein